MVQMDVITSLKTVKEELDSNLTKASTALEHFAVDTEAVHHLSECRDLLKQASSVLKLLEFDGATHLLNEMIFLIEQLQHSPNSSESQKFMEQMACLGLSLIQLEHFLEYTLLKERHLPLLLSGRINAIRKLLRQRPLSDATFIHEPFANPEVLDMYKAFGESTDSASFKLENVGPACKPFRLMFQVGLLAVIKEKKVIPSSVQIMQRALERLCAICGAVPMTKLWFIGRAVLLSLQYGHVSITPGRLFVLSSLERQIKQIVYGRDELLQMEPPEHLVSECMGIIALASVQGGATEQSVLLTSLQDLFNAKADCTDLELVEEAKLMNGPTGTVIQSVVQLIYDELAYLKEAMDLRSRDIVPQWNQEKTPHEIVEQAAHTLNMIGELESAAVLREQSPVIENLIDENATVESEALQSLADTFVFIEQALSKLLGQYAVNLDPDDESALTPWSILEQARHLVFVESRASLGVVKRSVASYVDAHGDGTYLDQVSMHLKTSVGALKFLHLDRAAQVLNNVMHYIDQYMIQQGQMPTPDVLETLADVLTSVDYYLESLEDRKSIGDGVLEAAELSVNMLKQAFEQSVTEADSV